MKGWTHSRSVRSRVARKVSCKWPLPHLKTKYDETMIKTNVTISNKLGLHARASAKLTKTAGSFPCQVWVSKADRRVNAKSIMGWRPGLAAKSKSKPMASKNKRP